MFCRGFFLFGFAKFGKGESLAEKKVSIYILKRINLVDHLLEKTDEEQRISK